MQYGHFDNEKREYVIDRVESSGILDQLSGSERYVCCGQSYSRRVYFLSVAGISQINKVSWEWGAHGSAGTLCVSER